jgi:GNAT superfamily N-acetyltransferase
LSYRITLEDGEKNYPELEPLYRAHYAEMQERQREAGIETGPYNPKLDAYFRANREGWLIHHVVRTEEGEAVGYSNLYLTNDAHNQEFISREDTIFIRKDHRRGVGRELVKHNIAELRRRGVKRWHVTAATDPRAALLWQRMGFKPAGVAMIYTF